MSSSLRALLVLGSALLCASQTSAQEFPCFNAGATPVDTLTVVHTTNPNGNALEYKLRDAQSTWEVTGMRTAGVTTSLFIPVESVQFSGTGVDSVNSVSTDALFLLIDYVSVRRALDNALISAPLPGSSYTIHVYHSGCIARGGSGSGTYFYAGMSGCCRKSFAVATPPGGGSPTIGLAGSSGPSCTTLQSTCDDEQLIFSLLSP